MTASFQVLWRDFLDDFRLGVLAYHRSEMEAVRCAIDCTARDVRTGVGPGGATGWMPLEPLGDPFRIDNLLVDGCRLLEIQRSAGFLGHADTAGVALVNSVFTGGHGGGSADFFTIGHLKVSQFHGHTLLLGCTLPSSGFYFDYPYIFGVVDIHPDSLMRGVIARVFFDDDLSSQPNWNNLTAPVVSGTLRSRPHTYALESTPRLVQLDPGERRPDVRERGTE